ncbi:hypothetical protein SSX86_010750 [Deinandra increscens subsp. villosa]|uniref:RRM domain-containing protein n=1 Tax=Deinandra increscens subsp. villosa TaxID=3103831 RepID=A0AAP0H2N0_9ASTR
MEREKEGRANVVRREDRETAGEEHWMHVSRRRSNEAVTFYVADLPSGCTSTYLWECFQGVGKLVDAFLPKNVDGRRRPFGFVRFKEVKCVETMLLRLRKIRLDGMVVRVYVSKFRKSSEDYVEKKQIHGEEKLRETVRSWDLKRLVRDSRRHGVYGMPYRRYVVSGRPRKEVQSTMGFRREEDAGRVHHNGNGIAGFLGWWPFPGLGI